jgi:hypothetical protein
MSINWAAHSTNQLSETHDAWGALKLDIMTGRLEVSSHGVCCGWCQLTIETAGI